MRFILAIFLPPLAVLLCGRPVSAAVNVLLCLLVWIPGVIHALMVVNQHKTAQVVRRELRRGA